MTRAQKSTLIAAVGDIHGRFHRVQEWLAALEGALSRPLDFVFAVGDVEAFVDPADHRRKATKRQMPAEFAAYADGGRPLHRPMHFIGGNNEDFASLHPYPEGGEVAPGLHYLGRSGVRSFGPLRVAYLSGIFAPKWIDQPLLEPKSAAAAKQAGYFRRGEAQRLESLTDVDVLLLHEWPKGLVHRGAGAALRAHRFPWIGNPIARATVEKLHPTWVFCGHTHVPLATSLVHPGAGRSQIACLDQAARPEGSVFWVEWEGRTPVRAGWGVDGSTAWTSKDAWDERATPMEVEPAGERMPHSPM